MRALLLLLIIGLLPLSQAAASDVKVRIASRQSIVPKSRRIVVDIYWVNLTEKPARIPSIDSYSFRIAIVDRLGKRLPSFQGGTVVSSHRSPNRTIAPKVVVRDQIPLKLMTERSDLIEITGNFWGEGVKLESNTIVLTCSR